MNEENRKTFFDRWLTEYSDRLQQVCLGIRESMQLLHTDMAAPAFSNSTPKSAEPARPGNARLNL
jgi:hypothetical protein